MAEEPISSPASSADRMLLETHKLLTAAIDALARTTMSQTDPQIQTLLSQSSFRLWESRYWLSEAVNLKNLMSNKGGAGDNGQPKVRA